MIGEQLKGEKMNFAELSEHRYSVRKFDPRPVEEEKLQLMLRAAQVAPTAVNAQPQKIYVLQSEEAKNKLHHCCRYIFSSPLVFLFCYDLDRVCKISAEGSDYNTGEMDLSIVCTELMMQAEDLGLGSVWVRGFRREDVVREFSLPENIVPVCLLFVGYPAEDCVPHPKLHFTNRPMEEIAEIL